MSSRAHSFCRVENRLPGPGATASLVCQILSWSLEPISPASPSSLHAETWANTGTCTQAHTWGSRSLAAQRTHTHAHISRHARVPRYICILVCTPVHTDISWYTCTQIMSTSCAYVHICRSILKCMQCPCTHMYTHRHTYPYIYMYAHRSRHAYIARPICIPLHTHIYTGTKLHTCIQMASIIMSIPLHTGLHSRT